MAHFKQERKMLGAQLKTRMPELERVIYRMQRPIEGWETSCLGQKQDAGPPPVEGWEPYTPGENWGGLDILQWFRTKITIPTDMAGWPVVALLHPGHEGLCYVDGVPYQGLDGGRPEVELTAKAEGGETFDIMVEAYSHPTSESVLSFSTAQLAVRDDLVRSFAWDIQTTFDVSQVHEEDSSASVGLLDLAHNALTSIDLNSVDDVEYLHPAIEAAQKTLRAGLEKYKGGPSDGTMVCVGQSHLDTAWLWPIRETRRKCGRTFSNALRLMDKYPEYTFLMSQAQIFDYVKKHYPALYEQVRQRVKEGRFELAGAAWVEQDLNVPSGEAHVRQYLYGNRFFREEFGVHTRNVWLPDCFGFTFALPQIMKKAQIDGFSTTKLWGNEYNLHPYSAFRWKGIDGSEVLSFMCPALCNSVPSPRESKKTWKLYQQKNVSDELFYTYGHGDGGGGANAQMIETIKRMENVTGLPRHRFGTVQENMDHISEKFDELPVFNDEMFYEKHRGCQTSQANTKKNNRKGELLARDTEILSSLAMLSGFEYPQANIEEAWKLILLNQFHDILPGSSIAEVYEDAEIDYAEAFRLLAIAKRSAIRHLTGGTDLSGKGMPIAVWNTLGWSRDDVASANIPADSHIIDTGGNRVVSQAVKNADGTESVIFEANVPAVGQAVFHAVDGAKRGRPKGHAVPKASVTKLENDFFTIRIDRKGGISRILDKRNGRDVLSGGTGNQLQLLDDRPYANDAWDINFNINDVMTPINDVVSVEVTEKGPVRATVRIVKKTEKSTITQDISIWRTNARIDFHTEVEWYEKHRLLKAAFPVDILSRNATYEIQFGAIERPTHWSTSLDRARFEVTGHRWIDLSESGYGVSLLNDCKYGFDVHDNVMRISLLRSPTVPDPHCDEGHHEFTYSLYPHAGTWQEAGTVRKGYELNAPLVTEVVKTTGGNHPSGGFVSVDADNVVIDSIKKAEDSDDLIVRVYEAHGGRGCARMTFAHAPESVTECDLMEENDVAVELDGASISFDIQPWEIRTFKVTYSSA
jgi:alpha-mannosidase